MTAASARKSCSLSSHCSSAERTSSRRPVTLRDPGRAASRRSSSSSPSRAHPRLTASRTLRRRTLTSSPCSSASESRMRSASSLRPSRSASARSRNCAPGIDPAPRRSLPIRRARSPVAAPPVSRNRPWASARAAHGSVGVGGHRSFGRFDLLHAISTPADQPGRQQQIGPGRLLSSQTIEHLARGRRQRRRHFRTGVRPSSPFNHIDAVQRAAPVVEQAHPRFR